MMTLLQARSWLVGARLVECGANSGAVSFKRVHTDTRSIEPGDLFVALCGERFDGNDFLFEAKAKGAVAGLCQETGQASGRQTIDCRLRAAGLPGLVVSDTKLALATLATHWRAQFKLPLIAVTGSNGKTTVTQMIAAVLRVFKSQAFLATQGNFNNDIGVPLTLLRLRPQHEVAVVELGMNHPGEIATLSAIAQPTVAVVNNAQREHLEFMASVQAVAQENGCVIDALGQNGVAVFPSDDCYSELWTAKAGPRSQLRFCAAGAAFDQAEVRCGTAVWSDDAWQVNLSTPAGPLAYALHIAGRHNVRNSLAAVAATLALGVPLDSIAQGLAAFKPVRGRSCVLRLKQGLHTTTLVDDSYNANPDSVQAAIDVLAELPGPRLLVLGDMGEVGAHGPEFHAQAGQVAHARAIDALFTLGDLSAAAAASFGAGRHFADLQALQAAVLAALPQMGSVLVKGSRFMRMERLVQAILAHTEPAREASHAA